MLNRFAALSCGVLLLAAAPSSDAGTLGLSWQASPGASGYRVHYESSAEELASITDAGSYCNQNPDKCSNVGNTTDHTLTDLDDCTLRFFAVSAYNATGDSPLSESVSSIPRPTVDAAAPSAAMQGTQLTLTVNGQNFDPDAQLSIDNPHILLENPSVQCDRIDVAATVLPLAGGERAAEVGQFTLTVVNPHNLTATRIGGFEVLLDPRRQDLNKTVPPTDERIDGLDLGEIQWLFACCGEVGPGCDAEAICPDFDFDTDIDGDGMVDGNDLSYVTNLYFGRCWDASVETWTTAACSSHASQAPPAP